MTDKEETRPSKIDIFWERYFKQYPKARSLQIKIANLFEEAWKDISPFAGEEMVGKLLTVDKSGFSKGTMIEALFIGIMAQTIYNEIRGEFEPQIKKFEELENFEKRLENEIIPRIFTRSIIEANEKLSKIEHHLITNTPEEHQLTEKIKRLIDNAKRELLLAGWVDTEFLEEIKKAKERDVEIKIITKTPDEKSPKAAKTAFPRLTNILGKENIGLNKTLHSRVLVVDDEFCMIGSADFTTHSAKTNFESAIFTNNPKLIDDAKTHFYEIWNDSDTKHPANRKMEEK